MLLLRGVIPPQQIAQFGARHFALEFGTRQHGREEAVLIEQNAFVERHVGDPDGALVTERAVVGEDRNFVNRAGFVGVQTAMAVVVADRIGGAEVSHPARFEERNQPGLMLS